MGYPSPDSEYDLPELGHLFSNNMANVSLDRLTGRRVWPTVHPYFSMWMNLVRLTDLSIRQYEGARQSLDDYRTGARSGRVSPLYDAINLFEEVVVAAHRAVLNSDGLQTVTKRKLKVPTARQKRLLRLARNHVQHMDEKLVKGQVKAGELHLIAPLAHSIEVGSVRLPYRDLCSVITKMYRNIEIIRQAPSA